MCAVLPEATIWYFGIALSGVTAYLAVTIPEPRDVFVPGADENAQLDRAEMRRRLLLSPHVKDKAGAMLPLAALPPSWREILDDESDAHLGKAAEDGSIQ